jgi:hypothetical protein
MRHLSQRDHHAPEPLWRRLDRAAAELNPFLMVLAIGLGMLQLTCLIGLLIHLPITHVDPTACAAPPSVTASVGASGK